MLAVWILLGFAIVAIAIPYFVIKHAGVGVWKQADRDDGAIGLSFDDGPDPVATPRVLDILERAGVKATFFVVGEAAAAHPELIARIRAAGHELACHGHRHRHALFQRWPLTGFVDTWRALADLDRLRTRLASAARPGEAGAFDRPQFYRGAHGAYSWSVLAAAWLRGVQPVNWTVEAHDWHPAFTAADVTAKVLREAASGGVIVMHDGGRGGARSIHALEPVLAGLAERGLRPMSLRELFS
jgi:peptidoglycan/xylan/chitin deacetylase (PgdA/CDA1 family)